MMASDGVLGACVVRRDEITLGVAVPVGEITPAISPIRTESTVEQRVPPAEILFLAASLGGLHRTVANSTPIRKP